jgi:NADH-quinone oxidoreductase subunit H
MFISSVIMSTLYFGGYDIPFFNEAASGLDTNLLGILGFLSLIIKAVIFVFIFMWVRWTIPRFRYDQLMNLGWKKLIPLALINMIITAALVLWLQK